jgi:hypothetical protein
MTKLFLSLVLWLTLACPGAGISWTPLPAFFSRGGATANAAAPVNKEVKTSNSSITAPLSQQSSSTETEDLKVLKADIELLSTILAETVQRSNPKIHDLYEQFRRDGLTRYV